MICGAGRSANLLCGGGVPFGQPRAVGELVGGAAQPAAAWLEDWRLRTFRPGVTIRRWCSPSAVRFSQTRRNDGERHLRAVPPDSPYRLLRPQTKGLVLTILCLTPGHLHGISPLVRCRGAKSCRLPALRQGGFYAGPRALDPTPVLPPSAARERAGCSGRPRTATAPFYTTCNFSHVFPNPPTKYLACC